MRIAVVSFHFYNTTAEGLATAKLARALVDQGHSVTVFTSEQNPLQGRHLAPSTGPLHGLTIHRVNGEGGAAPRWWRFVDARAGRNRAWGTLAASSNLLHRCTLAEWGWVKSVARRAISAWESEGAFDVLHTRLNPFISHLAGLEVVRRIPSCAWCAYFSDPWPHHLYPEPYRFSAGPVSKFLSERLLGEILVAAGSSVFPSARLKDYLLQGPRAWLRPRAFVAPHLANPWGGRRPRATHRRLTIRHAGFLMRERSIGPLYEGLRLFLARCDARRDIVLGFAGRYHGNQLPTAPEDLRDVVSFRPYLPFDAAWDWLQDADVLLLVEARLKEGVFFPSKLADYLASGRATLALSPRQGVTADLLASGGGILVEPDNAHAIADALGRLHGLWREGRLAELAPTAEQVRAVSAASVIPAYERAFDAARQQVPRHA